jgi:hypothetical protein
MALDYNPKDAVSVWPAGDYDATLKTVDTKTSKTSGNPMEVWTFEVYSPDGRQQLISDYVVIPAATFKIKQLALALGRKQEFEAGTFQAEDFIGAAVIAFLTIEQQDGYDDKNRVAKVKAPTADPSPPASPPPATRMTARPEPVGRPAAQQARPRPAASPVGAGSEFKPDDIPF